MNKKNEFANDIVEGLKRMAGTTDVSESSFNELLGCPFCGQKPSYEVVSAEVSRAGEWHVVECDNINCLEVAVHSTTKYGAYALWNKRAI